MTSAEIQTLLNDASCLRCYTEGSLVDLLKLSLLNQIKDAAADATPGGADTQVQFNDGGALGGDSKFTFNKTSGTIDLGGGTVTASDPVLSLTQTWNNAGVAFTGISLDVTDTSSGSSSLLIDLSTGGITRFSVSKSGQLYTQGTVTLGASATINWQTRGYFGFTADGVIRVLDNATTSFGRMCFGGTTAAFPSIKRSSAILQARLADDSAFTELECSNIITNNAGAAFSTNTTLTDNAGAGAGTITNAPSAGNPTKWIAIDDNGTPRYIPTWT